MKPNQSIADYLRLIDSLEDETNNTTGKIIVAGDIVNAQVGDYGMSTQTYEQKALYPQSGSGMDSISVLPATYPPFIAPYKEKQLRTYLSLLMTFIRISRQGSLQQNIMG